MSGERDDPLGATFLGEARCRFLVWAPRAEKVEVRILAPRPQTVALEKTSCGYHRAVVEGVEPGALYIYRLNGSEERPDPASRFQPRGVHGPSQVVDPNAFRWRDAGWRGRPLAELVFYELHVGAFTPEGTFDAVIPHLDELKELGVTAVELMPVAQFPGECNWGYDGVYPFAVQASYGGPDGLQRLVDACHQRGLAAVLDVVYNHLGPEGNCLGDFGPYFTDATATPWGPAINFDGAHNDSVRRYFIENALSWVTEFHFDALRLDAIHGIVDRSAFPFLAELAEAVHRRAAELGRQVYVVPESDLNDPRVVERPERGGFGHDAQWNDDFHHALHALLTGERNGYYQDFGRLEQLAKAFTDGFVYSGEYSAFRRRRHGSSSTSIPAHRFVVFAQNHDQVGNRRAGERLSQLVSFEALKLAAGVVLLSPFLPLLFMGEEYGETSPFQFFVSHSDPGLIEAVRRGRPEEFARFRWQGEIPDPQDEATFLRSKLRHALRREGRHRLLYDFHRELLRLRRSHPALARLSKEEMEVSCEEKKKLLLVGRRAGADQTVAAFHFGAAPLAAPLPLPAGRWRTLADSAAPRWQGPGRQAPDEVQSTGTISLTLAPQSFLLLARADETQP